MAEGSRYGWGLIGPGRFAREFAAELKDIPRADLVAVGSRSRERGMAFAEEFGFAKVYDDYAELCQDPEVDIVYVVVPHVFHEEIARMAINAGKAVVCEKPLSTSPETTRALVKHAQDRGVFLMEAMKTGFLPTIQKCREWINEGLIGEIQIIKADFCFTGSLDPEDRLMNPELGGGSVLDVGIYPLYLARHLAGEIEEIRSVGSLSETGVEVSVSMSALQESGTVSALTCSFHSGEAMDCTIIGTKGQITIPTFHAATKACLSRQDSEPLEYSDTGRGMVKAEIEAVMSALDLGMTECPLHTHRDSVKLAELMDSVIRQVRGQGGARQQGNSATN